MPFFNKKEFTGIAIIFVLILLISYISFLASLRRGRDEERIRHLDKIVKVIELYNKDFGTYPPSSEGMIKACENPDLVIDPDAIPTIKTRFEVMYDDAIACEWGVDSLEYWGDHVNELYAEVLVTDPRSDKGRSYYYISNGKEYQVYTSLESQIKNQIENNLEHLGVMCGSEICNFGKASGNLPIEKLIKEYENGLETDL